MRIKRFHIFESSSNDIMDEFTNIANSLIDEFGLVQSKDYLLEEFFNAILADTSRFDFNEARHQINFNFSTDCKDFEKDSELCMSALQRFEVLGPTNISISRKYDDATEYGVHNPINENKQTLSVGYIYNGIWKNPNFKGDCDKLVQFLQEIKKDFNINVSMFNIEVISKGDIDFTDIIKQKGIWSGISEMKLGYMELSYYGRNSKNKWNISISSDIEQYLRKYKISLRT